MIRFFVLLGAFGNVLNFGAGIHFTETILTTGGSLRGAEVEEEGIKFKAFKGIPYAAPPIGKLRFQDPQPAEIWEDVKNCVEYGHICYQAFKIPLWKPNRKLSRPKHEHRLFHSMVDDSPGAADSMEEDMSTRMKDQSEDCLTLNVYTRKLGAEAAQPVIFYIHGGGFFGGDGTDDILGPEFLVEQNIVVVTINYRLGPLGFLSTNTTAASGNWGLKDQVLALKWVQENIAQFGGDPKSVTLYGQAAGGSSAHYHMMSPLSKGLFHKVILSSGTATCDWGMTNDQDRFSENLAIHFGLPEKDAQDPEKRVEFLRNVDGQKLSDGMWEALEEGDLEANIVIPIPFLPVVEPADTKDPFIVEDPWKSILDGNVAKVPLMIGFNSIEAGFFMILPRFTDPIQVKKLDENLCLALPIFLRERIEEKKDCPKITEEIRNFYFGGKPIEGQFTNLTDLVGDSSLTHDFFFTQALHANISDEVYSYYFEYDGEWNMMKKFFHKYFPKRFSKLPSGALHGDDLTYVFNPTIMKLPFRKPSQAGLDTKARMISFVSNFARTGNPTPDTSALIPIKWEPMAKDMAKTMNINDDIKMADAVYEKRMMFWTDMYIKYAPKLEDLVDQP